MHWPSLYITCMIRGAALFVGIHLCVPIYNIPHSLQGICLWSRHQLKLIRHDIIHYRLVLQKCTYVEPVLVMVHGEGNLHFLTPLELPHSVLQLSFPICLQGQRWCWSVSKLLGINCQCPLWFYLTYFSWLERIFLVCMISCLFIQHCWSFHEPAQWL